MDQFRQHFRSTVIITPELLEQVPARDLEIDPAADPEVLIVGNTVAPGGARISNHRVTIVADGVGHLGGDDFIALTAVPAAAQERDGRVGSRLRVIAERLSGAAGTSQGQRGGRGRKGRDGVEMPPVDQPPFDPTGPKPPEVISRNGEKGGKGADGGSGGPVELVLKFPSTFTGSWRGVGGRGGEGGPGGVGEPPANQNSEPGEPGDPGDPGEPGPDVVATVRVGEADWRAALNAAGVIARWARLRTDLALEEFRRGHFAKALKELAAAGTVANGNLPVISPLAPHLPALIRDNRAVTGVARDQELVPDITAHAAQHTARAAAMAAALPDGATLGGDPATRLESIREQVQAMIGTGGSFTVRDNDLRAQVSAALVVLTSLEKRSSRTQARLTAILNPDDGPPADPTIIVDAQALAASAAAQALTAVLGAKAPFVVPVPADLPGIPPVDPQEPFGFQPSGDQATLLPVDLELLVHRSIRNRAETITDAELATLRAGAAGLDRLSEWDRVSTGQAGSDGKPVVVNLSAVAAALRAAGGDRAVVDLLVELAEVTHGWRLARARIEQLLAGRSTVQLQRAVATGATATMTALLDPGSPVEPIPADLLPGVRCLLDDLQWYADRAARASELLTFGLADPKPPVISDYPFPQDFVTGDIAALAPILHSPDRELDLRENGPLRLAPSIFDLVIRAVRRQDTAKPYADYLKRGIPIVGPAPAPVLKEFTATGRPDVIARFGQTGQFWLDVSLADLAGEVGTSPHAEARVVGVRVSLDFATAGPGVDVPLRVTHSGLSVQKDLAGGLHRQTLLPAGVEVQLAAQTDQLYVGETLLIPTNPDVPPTAPIDFPVYGRGAAAGWLVEVQDPLLALPEIGAIRVEVFYEGIVPTGTASLRSVAFAADGLRVGGQAAIHLTLTAPAGPGGVKVDLVSSDPETISVPAVVLVPPGEATAVALATLLRPTGPLPPTLTAKTSDGVTRRARPVVPRPAAPLVSSVRLAPSDSGGHVAAVAIAPEAANQPGRVLASFSPPIGPAPSSGPFGVVHERRADLAAVRVGTVGHGPRSLAVDPVRRRLYVANGGPQSVSVSMHDLDTLDQLGETVVGLEVDLAADPTAGLVYVSLFGAAKILILSADTLAVVGEVTDPTGQGRLRRPHGLAVFPGRNGDAAIYVARTVRGIPGESEESAVSQIRRAPNGVHTLVRSLNLGPILTQPVDVAVDPGHDLVFVSCLGGNDIAPTLIVLDHPTMTELGRVPLFSGGRAVAARPGSGLAYVAGEAGLTVVDGRALAVSARFPLGDQHLDQGLPLSVAVDPGTGSAYVGTRDAARLFRIDAPVNARQVFW